MKLYKYIAVILCLVFSFPGIGMESEEVRKKDITPPRPLKITITNDELDEEQCHFRFRNISEKKEISMRFENNSEVVFEPRKEKYIPYGITVYGVSAPTYVSDPEYDRVSAFFPKKGNSVEMTYYGSRDLSFDIKVFWVEVSLESEELILQQHRSIMEKAFSSLPNILPATSRFTKMEFRISIENTYASLVFNGHTFPSVFTAGMSSIGADILKGLSYTDLSDIHLSLRNSETGSLKVEVISSKMYGEAKETTMQQQ